MKAYFKSQWFNIFVGFLNLGLAIWNLCQGDEFMAACWMVSSVVWLIMSRVNHNEERIQMLEAKAEKYDAICELVEALREANEIDRKRDEAQDQKLRILFEAVHTLEREATK